MRMMGHVTRGLALLVVLPLFALGAPLALPTPQFPDGFASHTITEVYGSPTDLAWLGDDLLIAAQEGWVYRLKGADPAAEPQQILDVSARVGKGPEQGLLGVMPDPDFAENRFIYVYYTRARESGHCDVLPANCHNRVARFTMGADGVLDRKSELPLIDSILVGSLHNAGDVAFGPDGYLYVTTGDAGYWPNSQDLGNLNGKIMRIDRDGAPATGNPFSSDGVDCRTPQQGDPRLPCAQIYAFGLRNPFRIAFDPNSVKSRFFINDVGQTSWEEVDVGAAGANYGWPLREALCLPGSVDDCPPQTDFVEPIYAYSHESGCFAITGGAFVPDHGPWAATYGGSYLFADWGCGTIFSLSAAGGGSSVATPLASGMPTITPILFSSDGKSLYYASSESGVIHAIAPAATG